MQALYGLDSGWHDGKSLLTHAEAEALAEERCPECWDDDIDWVSDNLEPWTHSASVETYPSFEIAHTAAGLGIGTLGVLLTLPIVSRRRPGA